MLNFIKKEKVSVVFAICILALSLLVCIARYFPINVGDVYKLDADPIFALQKESVTEQTNCKLEADGSYKILGNDPQLHFNVDSNGVEAIKVNLTAPAEENINIEIYTAMADKDYSADYHYVGCIMEGETCAVIDLPLGEYQKMRVDINDDAGVVFKNVEFFDQQPQLVPFTPKRSVKDYVLATVIPVICTALAFFANKRFKMCERVAGIIKQNWKTLAMFVVLSIAAAPVSAFIEWALCNVERAGVFNWYRWLFFFGALQMVIVVVLLRKYFAQKPENLFLPLVLIMGFVLIFGTPIKHICWDMDSHYPWAVHTSYSGTTYIKGSYNSIDYVEPHTLMLEKEKFNLESYKEDIAALNEADSRLVKTADSQFSIAHLPAGLVIAVARMFGAGFSVRYTLGRMTYLLVYAFVCYFAIKKIKSGKMIISTICLFPTILYIATNYGYDAWVLAFSVLGISYFLSIMQEPEKEVSVVDTVIMCLAFAFAALPKLVYVILMGIPFFAIKKWKSRSEAKKYYTILAIVFFIMFVLFAITSLVKVGGGGDLRGGAVSPVRQIKFILANPFDYAKILIKFLRNYLSIQGMEGYISNYAYFGMGKWWPVFVMLLGITAVTDANSELKFKIPFIMKALSVLLFFGMAAIIATALYVDFTPVEVQTILGCQPRYIIPLLAPLLLLVTGQRKDLVKEKGAYNGFVLLTASSAVMMDVYWVIITRMV